MGQRRVPDGWAAWFLVLAAALPIVVIIRLGWKVMTGSADDVSGSQGSALTGLDLLGDRWSRLWLIQSIPLLPLMTLLPLTVLAVLVLTAPPRALIPTSTSRLAAVFVAVTTAGLGLIEGAAVAGQILGVLPGLTWGSVMGSQVEVYAPAAAMACTTTIVGATAAALLWPQRSAQRTHLVVNETGVEETTHDGAGDDQASEEVVGDASVAQLAPHRPASPPQMPAPSTTDLDLYRRR